MIGKLLTFSERHHDIEHSAFLVLTVGLAAFALFGVALPWDEWPALPPLALVFAVAVFLLRRPPVVLAGSRLLALQWRDGVFVGWFGPIGIAALYYLAEGRAHGHVGDELWATGIMVIALSTVIHGLTGTPGRRGYARRAAARGRSA